MFKKQTISKSMICACLLALVVVVSRCKDDSTALTQDQQIVRALSASTWNVLNVSKDDVEQTEFSDFTILFTGTLNYSVSGGPDLLPFPASGAWKLGFPSTSQLILGAGNQNIETTYHLQGSSLIIEFSNAGSSFPNGRVSDIGGQWKFTLAQN